MHISIRRADFHIGFCQNIQISNFAQVIRVCDVCFTSKYKKKQSFFFVISKKLLFVDYLKEVRIWYEKLMPRFEGLLYENGGPIILVQVENEYGAFECDNHYSVWLRNETKKYVGDKAVLFTNDIVREKDLKCGKIDNVLATLDFGIGMISIFI